MKPTLVVLAAGLGTRYGGLKQIDAVGPNGETIIDYALYDAMRAGFGKVVFVIRHYFEDAFKEKIGNRFDNLVETEYAYQELDACLGDFKPPADRGKPWGTGHALLVATDAVDGPFAVINADDYYGTTSFGTILNFITAEDTSPDDYAMVGYTLRNTLSDYGAVSRGVCQCDEQMFLRKIEELKRIEKYNAGARYFDGNGTPHLLTGDEIVSMNLWGFQPSVFDHFQSSFDRFLKEQGDQDNSELLIPSVTDNLIRRVKATVKVLPTNDTWFGVTYRQDRTIAAECVRKLINQGVYPKRLWA
jgi:NDP-sugar pyrophosphorylase family protein